MKSKKIYLFVESHYNSDFPAVTTLPLSSFKTVPDSESKYRNAKKLEAKIKLKNKTYTITIDGMISITKTELLRKKEALATIQCSERGIYATICSNEKQLSKVLAKQKILCKNEIESSTNSLNRALLNMHALKDFQKSIKKESNV
jgi:hypothetical protein